MIFLFMLPILLMFAIRLVRDCAFDQVLLQGWLQIVLAEGGSV